MSSRDEVISTARRMLALGLVSGTFGNVSRRLGEWILITPSGLGYETMRPEDLVLLDSSGEVVESDRPPSSEFRLHLEVYRRLPDVSAIVHTHSRCAVAYGDSKDELVASNDKALRRRVPVAPFHPSGTQDLADGAADLLVKRKANAVILRGHGVVGVGRDLDEALNVCCSVERMTERLSDASG